MTRGDDIEERLIEFAVRVIRVCEALSNRPAERHIRGQLLRSGTSPAPNYGEARAAESGKDFVHIINHSTIHKFTNYLFSSSFSTYYALK